MSIMEIVTLRFRDACEYLMLPNFMKGKFLTEKL